jgi:hypothetical protein
MQKYQYYLTPKNKKIYHTVENLSELILQVYMLLFENRKFVVMFRIFVNSQNMIKS